MTSSIPTTTAQPQARAYSLAELMSLKPGFIFGGLVHEKGNLWKLGDSWGLLETDYHPRRKSILPRHPISEHKVKWRQRLRPYFREINGSRIYGPPRDLVSSVWSNPANTISIGFNVALPLGMYLGHILRVDGVTLVNVLAFEGYDVWL